LAGMERVRVAVFDHAGNLLRTENREVPQSAEATWQGREANRAQVRDAWLAELGYQSATIQVKRFTFGDRVGLTDFNWWADAFDNPNDSQLQDLGGAIERWLAHGQYRFGFGGSDAWFARDGEVTDT